MHPTSPFIISSQRVRKKMAFDKVKTLRAAERYLELGKIPAAIKEYCKIVEDEPEDFTTLNMLGDLHVRVGNQDAAISCFHRIAEHYRDQDFGLKAIAMYRKIDRLRPHNIQIAVNLADLYASQDLVVEARAHYLMVAEAHNRAGATKEGLEVLRKIADLDPQNTDIRIKLAEGYVTEGMTGAAACCFTEAGMHLLERGAIDAALQAFAKALEITPADRASLKGLLAAHCARGTADEAAEVIERASANNPDDVELLSMLASAQIEAEDPAEAEQATANLVAKESAAYRRYVDVARLYLATDKFDDAVRVVAEIAERMLAEREEAQLLELVNELLTCDSDNVQALRLLVRTYWWQRDTENLKAALERLAEAAEAAGLEKDERYALTQLTRLAPELAHHAERLNQLGGAEEEAAAETLPGLQPEEVKAFAEIAQDAHEVEFDSTSLSIPCAESEPDLQPVAEIVEPSSPQPDWDMEIERGFTFEAVVAEELPAAPNQEFSLGEPDESAGADSVDQVRKEALRRQELESVDFYIAQGYVDIALDTLELLERQFGSHIDIDSRRQQLLNPAEAAPPASVAEVSPNDVVVNGEAEFEFAAPIESERSSSGPQDISQPAPTIDPGLAEVFEEYRVSAEGEAQDSASDDYETHYNLGLAYQEMDLFEEALEEFQLAVSLVAPGDGTSRYLQCCNLLGQCFLNRGVPQLAVTWFNKGLNTPGASEDERQALRFDLAAAYEQAGDLERAIDIFTEVYGINVSYRGVNERLRVLQARAGSNGKAAPGSKGNLNPAQHVH
jgi:tetratricopeptide (TPR) repeat protein